MTRLEQLERELSEKRTLHKKCMAVPRFQSLAPTAEIQRLETAIKEEQALQNKIEKARASRHASKR